MRGRKKVWIEEAREGIEGELATLGIARALLALVADRVIVAQKTGQTSALVHAKDDLRQADRLIDRVQGRIGARFEALVIKE